MNITNIFTAVKYGDYERFKELYDKSLLNEVDTSSGGSLLTLVFAMDEKYDIKLNMMQFLLDEGIDVNITTKRSCYNALHMLFTNIKKANFDFYMQVTKSLVEAGIDVKTQCKHGATPLNYAVAVSKLDTETMYPLYLYLLQKGSPYEDCIELANRFSWRAGFLDIVKEYEKNR